MDDKASFNEPSPTRTEAEGATVDLPEGFGFLTTGQVLGDRYEILEMLGRGGMGEVWRAFDLKLRVDVALKSLRAELTEDGQALETLRQEVRVAREVISPNVCRVFDLQEVEELRRALDLVDGHPLETLPQSLGVALGKLEGLGPVQ